jgi:hypothetical protein
MPGLAKLARMPRGREGKSDMIIGGTVEAVNDNVVSLGRRGTVHVGTAEGMYRSEENSNRSLKYSCGVPWGVK